MVYAVSAPNLTKSQFLGVDALFHGSGYNAALGFYNKIMAAQISHLVIALVCDTPTVNWGVWEGAVYYIATWLDKQLLFIQCVHHTEELVPKTVSLVASQRPTTQPANILFKRFQNSILATEEGQSLWDIIQDEDVIYNIHDEEQYVDTVVETAKDFAVAWAKEARRQGDFPRDTYANAVDLLLVFSGVMLPSFKIPHPPPPDKSRFLSDGVNYLILEVLKDVPEVRVLYSEEEWIEIGKMALFSAYFYIPWLCLAKNAAMAPANLLTAISHLRSLKEMPEFSLMAEAGLKKRGRHLQFLSAELSIFELFNVNTATSSLESRRRLGAALAVLLPQWTPGNFLINAYHVPDIDFCTNSASSFWEEGVPSIASFATKNSFLLPELLGLRPADMNWLLLEPEAWSTNLNYRKIQEYVTKLEVTNDVAERDVNLLSLKKSKVRTLARLNDSMIMTSEGRRVRGSRYCRKGSNQAMNQIAVDKLIAVTKLGRSWLGDSSSEEETDEEETIESSSEEESDVEDIEEL